MMMVRCIYLLSDQLFSIMRVRDCTQRNGASEETCYSTADPCRRGIRHSAATDPYSPACRIHNRMAGSKVPVVSGACGNDVSRLLDLGSYTCIVCYVQCKNCAIRTSACHPSEGNCASARTE